MKGFVFPYIARFFLKRCDLLYCYTRMTNLTFQWKQLGTLKKLKEYATDIEMSQLLFPVE